MRQMRSRFHSTPMMSIDPPKQHFIHCSGGHDLSEKLACACLRRSDTLLQHQSDQRHCSYPIPTRGQKDDTSRLKLAA